MDTKYAYFQDMELNSVKLGALSVSLDLCVLPRRELVTGFLSGESGERVLDLWLLVRFPRREQVTSFTPALRFHAPPTFAKPERPNHTH